MLKCISVDINKKKTCSPVGQSIFLKLENYFMKCQNIRVSHQKKNPMTPHQRSAVQWFTYKYVDPAICEALFEIYVNILLYGYVL